jgi:hypothetical protein
VDALQVALLGGFPGDPFGDEFFSHYLSIEGADARFFVFEFRSEGF